MLKNSAAARTVLAYGGFVLSDNKLPIGFGRELTELPTGLPAGFTFELGSINVGCIAIEQLSTYDNFASVGLTLDRNTNRGDVTTMSLGLWHQTKKGWKLISSPYKIEAPLQTVVAELLVENGRASSGVRVTTPRGTEQRKIEKLAQICGLTDGHWTFNEAGDEVYVTYEYSDRNFDPYKDDFWIWEIIKRVGLTVHHLEKHLVKLTHPNPTYVFEQSSLSYQPLRQALCNWLLEVTEKRERS